MTTTRTSIPIDDIVGIGDIADRLGVQKGTIDTIRKRDKNPHRETTRFPDPAGHLSGYTPWWDWDTVREWAEATGRL